MNTAWSINELQNFIAGAQFTRQGGSNRYALAEAELVAQAQVVEQIFNPVIPDWRDRVKGYKQHVDHWGPHREVAQRALAQLQRAQEIKDNLGDNAPDLNASHLHQWVWDGARSLWASTHFRQAVSAAAIKVNAETQNKLGRKDLSEVKLFQEAFSLKLPEPGKPRLRITKDDGSDTYKNVHSGATAFATGCYQAIRNPAAHEELEDLPEDEALEQLAAFSILARWVDRADLEKG